MTIPSEELIAISKGLAGAEHRNETTHVVMLEMLATFAQHFADLTEALKTANDALTDMSSRLEAIETHVRRTEIQTRR